MTSAKHLFSIFLFLVFTGNISNKKICASEIFPSETSNIIRPNATLIVDQYDDSISHRQNFCDIHSKINKGQLNLSSSLEGLDIHVSLFPDKHFVNVKGQGKDRYLDLNDAGVMVEILDKVAESAKFRWRNTFVFEEPPPDDDWAKVLYWTIRTYDISINWWSETGERISKGVAFPTAWIDNDTIIIGKNDLSKNRNPKLRLLSWMDPFTHWVWVSIFGTLILSGFIYYFIQEHLSENSSGPISLRIDTSKCLFFIQKCLMVFPGNYDIEARSHSGELIGFSLSVFAMLIVSAYTANLASFLVAENISNSIITVETVDDIVRGQYSMCIYGGTSTQKQIQERYDTAIFRKFDTDEEVLIGLRNSLCDYAIIGETNWKIFQRKKSANGDCNLRMIGRRFIEKDAGFATNSDAGTKCTSLVRDVVSAHLKEIKKNGEFEKVWNDFLEKKQDISDPKCYMAIEETDPNENVTMGLFHLGGIFVSHFLLLSIAIATAFCQHYYRKGVKTSFPYHTFLQNLIQPLSKELNDVKNDSKETSIALKEALTMFEEMKKQMDRIEGRMNSASK